MTDHRKNSIEKKIMIYTNVLKEEFKIDSAI